MNTNPTITSGYAPVNGLQLYYEIHGTTAPRQPPLILLHGGLGSTGMFGEVLPQLAQTQQVIAVDLQAHGRTADVDRPMRYESMGDDIAALIQHLALREVNLMGYSLGAGVALRTVIRHPQLVHKLVIVSTPFSRNGWYPQMVTGMDQLGSAAAEFMRETPMYQSYVRIAPQPENFPVLLDKIGDMLRQPYDLSGEVAGLRAATLLIFGDADSIPPSHAAEFFALLGGGQKDGEWDESGMTKHRLAIVPGSTHYNIFSSPLLPALVTPFLAAEPTTQTRWGE